MTAAVEALAAQPLFDVPSRNAVFSACGRYRWSLHRWWAPGPTVLWVMLNPSTADACRDDPTIRRCIGFSHRWGFGGLAVVNLFGLRSTDPAALLVDDDPVGADNDTVLEQLVMQVSLVVAAWGAHPISRTRAALVRPMLGGACCLGLTRDGQPRHPLYVRAETELRPF